MSSAPGAGLTEVDTDWNGTVQSGVDLNNFDLFALDPGAAANAVCCRMLCLCKDSSDSHGMRCSMRTGSPCRNY